MLRPTRPTPSSRYSPYGGGAAAHVQVVVDEETDQVFLDKLLAGVDPGQPGPRQQPAGGAGEFCQFFSKTGWCKWGDGCRYRHEAPDGQQPPATAELCQFFSKAGWCQWRENCKYIHALPTAAIGNVPDSAMPDLPAPCGKGKGKGKGGAPSVMCDFFTKAGWCKWGETCRYIHAGTVVPGLGPSLGPRPPQARSQPDLNFAARPAPIAPLPRSLLGGPPPVCKYFASPGGCKNGELCPFEHIGEPGEPEVCQFFAKAGWCKWNEACKYVHAGGPDVPLGGGGKGAPAPGEVCQFFTKAGWCKWGEGCRFAHEGGPPPEGRGRPGPGAINEICQFFSKSGWCKWADACKYIHAAEPEMSQLQDMVGDQPDDLEIDELELLPGEGEVVEGDLAGAS